MLDEKNSQLKNKDDLVNKMRKDLISQKEQDGLEIAGLQQKLSITAGTTLNKLHEIVVKHEAGGIHGASGGRRHDNLTREELARTLEEKDAVIRRLGETITALKDEKTKLTLSKTELRNRVEDLDSILKQQRQQDQLQANMKELDQLHK